MRKDRVEWLVKKLAKNWQMMAENPFDMDLQQEAVKKIAGCITLLEEEVK